MIGLFISVPPGGPNTGNKAGGCGCKGGALRFLDFGEIAAYIGEVWHGGKGK